MSILAASKALCKLLDALIVRVEQALGLPGEGVPVDAAIAQDLFKHAIA